MEFVLVGPLDFVCGNTYLFLYFFYIFFMILCNSHRGVQNNFYLWGVSFWQQLMDCKKEIWLWSLCSQEERRYGTQRVSEEVSVLQGKKECKFCSLERRGRGAPINHTLYIAIICRGSIEYWKTLIPSTGRPLSSPFFRY